MPVRFGVLSARARGAYLAMIFHQHPRAEVLAIADPDPTAFDDGQPRYDRAGLTGFRRYNDSLELMAAEKGNLDWIIIASPDRTHHSLTLAALRHGYHVLVEKPMCQTLAEAEEIIRVSEETGQQVVVGCELRYASPMQQFRRLLREGAIGRILHGYCIDSVERGFTYYLRDYRKRQWSGSLLLQKGVHSLDLINDFVDSQPERIYADGGKDLFGRDPACAGRHCRDCAEQTTCPYSAYQVSSWNGNFLARGEHARDHCVFDPAADVEDNTIILIRYANGIRVSYNELHFAPDYRREFHFVGTDGKASLVLDQSRRDDEPVELQEDGGRASITITHRHKSPCSIPVERSQGGHWGGDERLRDALVEAALAERRMRPDARDGWAALAICHGAHESMASGLPITINRQSAQSKTHVEVLP